MKKLSLTGAIADELQNFIMTNSPLMKINSPDFSFSESVSLPVFPSLVRTKNDLMIRIIMSICNDINSNNTNSNSFFIHRAENTYQMLIMHIHPSLKVNNLNNI